MEKPDEFNLRPTDPQAPYALRAYAYAIEQSTKEKTSEYADAIRDLAFAYENWRKEWLKNARKNANLEEKRSSSGRETSSPESS